MFRRACQQSASLQTAKTILPRFVSSKGLLSPAYHYPLSLKLQRVNIRFLNRHYFSHKAGKMDDSEHSFSEGEGSAVSVNGHDIDELPLPVNEVIDDLTGDTDETVSEDGSFASLTFNGETLTVKARTYQLEMLEESLKRNIIIADLEKHICKILIDSQGFVYNTGAVMRILHELENKPPHQQFLYIKSQIPSVLTKLLSGADNVERWTNQLHWDEVLKNVRIVVSPHQILLEALSHGFVQITSLSMIVFDEAHNCVGKHPGAVLMRNFYHEHKARGLEVPKILGLTASPVMRSTPSSVSKIEQTLDAICRTPKKHRDELRLHVKLPTMIQVQFQSSTSPFTKSVTSLSQAFKEMNLNQDPYFLILRRDKTDRGQRKLQRTILDQKTWSRDQIKSFSIISERINEELGDWAADFYVSHVVSKAKNLVKEVDGQLGVWDGPDAEKQYVAKVLEKVHLTSASTTEGSFLVSNKVTKLIEVLLEGLGQSSGIVFVKERATAYMLAELLRLHPQTCNRFKVGTVVGMSQHSKRSQSISELVDTDPNQDALAMFRAGKLDIVIATSVLEEGLDVPGCNLVICFEKPANLKSFVQRRGRARHEDSKLILLLDSQDQKLQEWAQLEAEMRAIYEDEMRVLEEMILEEDAEEHDGRVFRVERTNAVLDLDSAVAHLYHFCAVLPKRSYVDNRPDFICTREKGKIRAKVILPLSVHEAVRVAESQKAWNSEKNAIKDAAFQAYIALYHAGLVNDNLLPLIRPDEVIDESMTSARETRASLMEVNQQLNPWIDIAHAWGKGNLFKCNLSLGNLDIQMYLPVAIPHVRPFKIYWDATTELVITSEPAQADHEDLDLIADETWTLLHIAFGSRFLVEKKQVVMQFSPERFLVLPSLLGHKPAEGQTFLTGAMGLIRDSLEADIPYVFQRFLPTKPHIRDVQQPYADYDSIPENTPHFAVKRLQKRQDLLHEVLPNDQPASIKPYSTVLPVSRCTIDEIAFPLVQFGLIIPSIMRRYEVHLVAKHLSDTLLKSVQISDLSLIVTAICASSAREETNYQRLEFIGDSILKMCTCVQLLALHPLWHEGYLSSNKDRVVANSRLAKAAVDLELDRFIVTKSFTGSKWRPPYVEDLVKMEKEGTRQLSSKVLADVVEALIGAAMVDGGLPKAIACLQVFLPELDWQLLALRRGTLFDLAPITVLPSTLVPLEELIGYKFEKKALLIEAMTHASYNCGSSLERLEFLGDSVLDYVILTELCKHDLSNVQMHLLRTALVNADFLAFICMEWCASQEVVDLITPDDPSIPITKTISTIKLPLWCFMRHASPQLAAVQSTNSARHSLLRGEIKHAIEHGESYPWDLLARLQAQKFYSDIVESLLGAVWIDSGSFDTCRDMVARMGILSYMERVLKDEVHVWHPKEELGVYADTEKVRYVLEREDEIVVHAGEDGSEKQATNDDDDDGVEGRYACTIFVGEEEVVRVTGGVNKVEVRTRAAEQAVKILRARKERVVDKGLMRTGLGRRKTEKAATVEVVEVDTEEDASEDFEEFDEFDEFENGGVDLLMGGI